MTAAPKSLNNITPHEQHPHIGIGRGLSAQQVIESICGFSFKHIVQEDGLAFSDELRAACEMTKDPSAFIVNPLDVILGESAIPETALTILNSAKEKKQKVLSQFSDYLQNLKGTRAIVEQALMIADELYTNGAKNAWPKDKSLFEGEPVREGTLEFFAQASENRLIFGCRDSFGELNTSSVVDRIHKCMILGVAGAIRQGPGGAGIGSYMVFDACISYYAGVNPGKNSVVCVAMPLGLNRRAVAGLPKNIHLIA